MPDQPTAERVLRTVAIKVIREEQRLVYGEVLAPVADFAPGTVVRSSDLSNLHYDGGAVTAPDIERLAHAFLTVCRDMDADHNGVGGKAVPVESFIAGAGWDPWTEGAWVVGAKVVDDAEWDRVKRGELTGFSVEMLTKVDLVEVVEEGDA